jgi:AraC-like DNA-binding protein
LLTLYLETRRIRLFETCVVVAVDRLVSELLVAASAFGPDYPARGPEARLMQVILDRLPALAVAPLLHLPRPTSGELVTITAALAESPGNRRTLGAWASSVGLGEKTAARKFLAETGMTFGRWRQHCRLLAAIERLAAGETVTRVAFEVGYGDVSSFIASFKSAMGTTPSRYFGE